MVARCPVFNQTVRYFGSMFSGIKMIEVPDNACVNSSIFCATDTETVSAWYFGESHLATVGLLTDHFLLLAQNLRHHFVRRVLKSKLFFNSLHNPYISF